LTWSSYSGNAFVGTAGLVIDEHCDLLLLCDAALEHVDTLHHNVDEIMKDLIDRNLQCSNMGTVLAGFVALALFLRSCQ
jgi:hypothetical protein